MQEDVETTATIYSKETKKEVLLHLDDPVLRALLYGRKTEAKNKNITFYLDADTAVLPNFPLESHQIVEVFDNLLDNAFECTETLSNQRWIRVSLTCQKLQSGQFENIFCVQNPYKNLDIHAITSQKNFTSKGSGHKGIGLKTVKRIVSNTQGQFTISCDNNIFTAKVVFWD